MNTVTNAKQVLISTAAVEDVIERAQVMIVTDSTWHILGPAKAHIARMFQPAAPAVTCPVVDISELDECLDQEVAQIVSEHVLACGVRQVEVMISGLEKIGAKVLNTESVEFGSEAWFAALPEMEF